MKKQVWFSKYVKPISLRTLKKKYKIELIDLVKKGFFSSVDYHELNKTSGIIYNLPKLIKNPPKSFKQTIDLSSSLKNYLITLFLNKKKKLNNLYPINDYILKTSIITAFKPKGFLEIGTFTGWGVSAIKFTNPKCNCYTISPKDTKKANNPVKENHIGIVYRKKGLKVNQLYGDSLKYDFKKISPVDATYIDGNHKYKWVISDLIKSNKITKKIIVIDDYIPSKEHANGYVKKYGAWHKEVTRAVEDFLKKHHREFKHAYWIEKTPVCVLIK